VVRSDFKGKGLGHALLDILIRQCREAGLSALTGQVLSENRAMLDMAKKFGFQRVSSSESGVTQLRLDLNTVERRG
jgi:acetyltransferase